MALFDYQLKSAERILDAIRSGQRFVLDASDTGSGKTPKTCHILKTLGKPFAIICPKMVIPTWKRWCAEYDIEPQFILNYEKLKTGRTPYGKFEDGVWKWDVEMDTFFVFDEAHKCKGRDSQNGKVLSASKPYAGILLSATVADNPLDLFHTGYVLGLHDKTNYWSWAHAHGVRPMVFTVGGRTRRQMVWWGKMEDLGKIRDAIFPKKGDKVKVDEVPDFPRNNVFAEAVDYNCPELQKKLALLADPEFTEITEVRREIELLRVPLIAEIAKERHDEGKSVVVFANYHESIDALCKALRCRHLDGRVPEKQRQRIIEDFQNNKETMVVCQIQLGIGIDLHDLHGRPRVSLLCPTFSAVDLKQAIGRIWRQGAKSTSFQYIYFCAGSYEEEVCKKLQKKLRQIETLTDTDLQ